MTEKQRLDHLYEVLDDLLYEIIHSVETVDTISFELLRKKLADGMEADADE